jgi:hypothetical protein
MALALLAVAAGLSGGVRALTVCGGFAVLVVAVAVRYALVCVRVGPEGLEVHNFFGGWRAPWSEIAAFTTRTEVTRGDVATVYPVTVLRSGRRREISALGERGDREEVELSIRWLQSQAPPGAQPAFVRRAELEEFLAALRGEGAAGDPPPTIAAR